MRWFPAAAALREDTPPRLFQGNQHLGSLGCGKTCRILSRFAYWVLFQRRPCLFLHFPIPWKCIPSQDDAHFTQVMPRAAFSLAFFKFLNARPWFMSPQCFYLDVPGARQSQHISKELYLIISLVFSWLPYFH